MFPTLYCNEELENDVAAVRSAAATTSDDESSLYIGRLLDSEPRHMPRPDYLRLCRDRPVHVTSRQDSVNYILKVHAHFRFKPVTAFLSVNYFDRFLSAHTLPENTGWSFQLLSVACISLAAKMEEIYVPLLLELQMLEPRYVFEPKTIQRMELMVMATLEWRLRAVTPFDYLHCFVSVLIPSSIDFDSRVYALASDIIVNTTRVIDFLEFPPSVMAAAAVISAAGGGVDFSFSDNLDERVNREMVRSCHQLMEEYLLDTCPAGGIKAVTTIERLAPPSPSGVLDAAACASCDTHTENPAGSASGAGEDEPENKG